MIHSIRIQSWLRSIQDSDIEAERPSKRLCHRNSLESDIPSDPLPTSQPSNPALGTPPLTEAEHMPQVALHSKRTADDSNCVDSRSEAIASDVEKTPKARKILIPVPRRPRTRSRSPTKSRTGLHLLEKPVIVDTTCALPSDVETLHSDIQNAVEFKQGILPNDVPNPIEWLGRLPPSHCFRVPEPVPNVSSRAKEIHVALCRIRRAALSSAQYQRHEQAWNNMVHTPLLELVFRSDNETDREDTQHAHAIVAYEPMMTATIAGDSIPLFSGAGLACSVSASSVGDSSVDDSIEVTQVHSSSSSKKVDYALVLRLPDDSTLSKLIRSLVNDVAIRDGESAPHINQTTYLPVTYSPIAVSIETKPQFSSQDPLIQLGLWTAAWHKRMSYLRSQLDWSTTAAPQRLVSLPLIQVVGHHWHMYFACDLGSSIMLHGPVSLGSTESLMSMYTLLTSLGAVKSWIETQFSTSIAAWFGLS
ncbi:hypothetical protein F5B22DRAFT_611886 [Xylaria bambusicola]|uniref:uncharacterized protein n=1 Tax=Xylaria bambusicola TaxID=326684 RepID=UPI0020077853|nr:uncharacterized protein F5B22DRAFT_611886 [Xylaria bambusicola]KAI0513270.1 hypothetical protein F5B22DRAFT_611886 [Xylaria bambusicola]